MIAPHCGTKQASFQIRSEFHSPAVSIGRIYAFVVCEINILSESGNSSFSNRQNKIPRRSSSELVTDFSQNPSKFVLVDFYPKSETPEIPEHLPKNVHTYYLEAVNSVKEFSQCCGDDV